MHGESTAKTNKTKIKTSSDPLEQFVNCAGNVLNSKDVEGEMFDKPQRIHHCGRSTAKRQAGQISNFD